MGDSLSYSGVAMMVNHVGIYGFCLFKQKRWVRADVSININMYGLKPAAGKEISEEEGNYPLIPSSTNVTAIFCGRLCGCRRQCVSSDINDLQAGTVGRFGQLNMNSQAQSVCVGGDAQLLLVASTRAVKGWFEVVVISGRSATTTRMLQVGLEFQMLLTLA